ncbi:MAG TPA: hypothetical protein VMX12_12045 [Acidimicrobiia bacterium]|nr:hypothetical protein [Acidimicrobiia bacterium]
MADGSTAARSDLAAQVAEVEQLPDGRQLVLFADRRSVVVGVARPRPHPVVGCEWLWEHPPLPPARPRRTPPARPRRPVRTLPDDRDSIVPGNRSRRRPTAEVTRRAEALLCSLLDPMQRADWDARGAFWVETPRGPVRLGELYWLLHRPYDEPGWEHALCVVPHGYEELPIADVWSNLLLVLAVEPEEFFRVAILQESHRISR